LEMGGQVVIRVVCLLLTIQRGKGPSGSSSFKRRGA